MSDVRKLMQLLKDGISAFHVCRAAEERLRAEGFSEIVLSEPWKLVPGGKYMVRVFDSTLFAFTVSGEGKTGQAPELRMASAHTDWPCLKIKPNPEFPGGPYARLNAEVYGGPVYSTWMDRPLGISGRVFIRGRDAFHPEERLFDSGEPVLIIPNLAIHMNREVNKGVELNPQTDLIPIAGMVPSAEAGGAGRDGADAPEAGAAKGRWFVRYLAEMLDAAEEDILDFELWVYNPEEPEIIGLYGDLLSSPRLDNLTSVEACLEGIAASGDHASRDGGLRINAVALYDNEEIGSRTKQGALSEVTSRILEKICLSLGLGREEYFDMLSSGFMISMDVAHAVHPGHPEKCDPVNRIPMGAGVALKLSSSQSYATDARAVSIIEGLLKKNGIAYAKFSNRSDMRGGSTLGALSSAKLGMLTADVGAPILAMHSARELMCVRDQEALNSLAGAYFTD